MSFFHLNFCGDFCPSTLQPFALYESCNLMAVIKPFSLHFLQKICNQLDVMGPKSTMRLVSFSSLGLLPTELCVWIFLSKVKNQISASPMISHHLITKSWLELHTPKMPLDFRYVNYYQLGCFSNSFLNQSIVQKKILYIYI